MDGSATSRRNILVPISRNHIEWYAGYSFMLNLVSLSDRHLSVGICTFRPKFDEKTTKNFPIFSEFVPEPYRRMYPVKLYAELAFIVEYAISDAKTTESE